RDVYSEYRRLLKEELSVHSITLTQWGMLRYLVNQDGVTQKVLSEAVGIHPSTAVEAIRKLEERGLVSRLPDPTDGRAVRVILTKQGRAVMAALYEVTVKVNQIACEPLTDQELVVLESLLGKIKVLGR